MCPLRHSQKAKEWTALDDERSSLACSAERMGDGSGIYVRVDKVVCERVLVSLRAFGPIRRAYLGDYSIIVTIAQRTGHGQSARECLLVVRTRCLGVKPAADGAWQPYLCLLAALLTRGFYCLSRDSSGPRPAVVCFLQAWDCCLMCATLQPVSRQTTGDERHGLH